MLCILSCVCIGSVGVSPPGSHVHTDINCICSASAFSLLSNVIDLGSSGYWSRGATPFVVFNLLLHKAQNGFTSSFLVFMATFFFKLTLLLSAKFDHFIPKFSIYFSTVFCIWPSSSTFHLPVRYVLPLD